MTDPLVDLVNNKDEIIGTISRKEAHEKELWHRLIEVWFFDSQGRILLQKRSKQKKVEAGILEWTVSGHVDSGETYEEALVRETQEETGVKASLDEFLKYNKKIGEKNES